MAANDQGRAGGAAEDLVDQVLTALGLAKEAFAMLPPLPPGVRPAHVRILSAMDKLGRDRSRVSDINTALGAALPNTTKLVSEMVELKIVQKASDPSDKRVVRVQTTAIGDRYIEVYVHRLHDQLLKAFARIGKAECLDMVETLRSIHEVMSRLHSTESYFASATAVK